jgi:hypothetical protein
MARGRFEADIDLASMKRLGKKRTLVLTVSADDGDDTREMIRTYEQDAVKRVEAGERPRRIVFMWDIQQGKRSLAKNALIWSLLGLTAKLQNEGMPDGAPKRTKDDLYNEDMGDVFPSRKIVVEQDSIGWLGECGVKVMEFVPIEGTTLVTATVTKTSSDWDDLEAHRYIEHLFNRLAMSGVPLPEDQVKLKDWWVTWMEAVDESRVELHADVLTRSQYAKLHPLCEGCMKFIGQGGGQIAHIKSVGAGGDEPELANGAEWLHLCGDCHIGIIHAKGWEEFKQRYRHLSNKVDAALSKPAVGVVLEANPAKLEPNDKPVKTLTLTLQDVENMHRELSEKEPPAPGQPGREEFVKEIIEGQAELDLGQSKRSLRDYDDDPQHPIV